MSAWSATGHAKRQVPCWAAGWWRAGCAGQGAQARSRSTPRVQGRKVNDACKVGRTTRDQFRLTGGARGSGRSIRGGKNNRSRGARFWSGCRRWLAPRVDALLRPKAGWRFVEAARLTDAVAAAARVQPGARQRMPGEKEVDADPRSAC